MECYFDIRKENFTKPISCKKAINLLNKRFTGWKICSQWKKKDLQVEHFWLLGKYHNFEYAEIRWIHNEIF